MKRIAIIVLSMLAAIPGFSQARWQQTVNTIIGVTLDDKNHFLHGYEELTYINNSPDTLRFIYIHLWPNAYQNDRTPFAQQMDQQGDTRFYYSKTSSRGYIDSLEFVVDGQSVDYNSSKNAPDIARIDLPNPLLPGKEIKITTPFRVKIPEVFSRLGHTGQAYYISQWFPKPAVYDQKGWHPLSFLELGEFYSNYGSYDVTITLPKNYIVMATGNCTDESEQKWLDDLAVVPLPADTQYSKDFPPSSYEMKSVHFHEDRVHDFAWFADKRWIVRKDTVTSPGSGQVVTAYAAYLPEHQRAWRKATEYLRNTVQYYGKWVGPYMYKTIKAVEGDMHAGGGMEYPTVTIIDKKATSQLRTTIIHEGGHNWFYGMLGSNERDHAWMDEGINTFYEQKTSAALNKLDTNRKKNIYSIDFDHLLYYQAVSTHTDQAIDQTSANFTKLNYGGDVYYKTALMLRWLEIYMGEEAFEAGMHDYYNTWKINHPYPEDLKAVLQKHTDKSLDWFFDGALNTDKRIDFKVTKVHTHDDQVDIRVRNKSSIAAPVQLVVAGKDKVTYVWIPPFEKTAKVENVAAADWTSIKVSDDIPDAKTDNNKYRRYALFHKFRLAVRPFNSLTRSYSDKFFISPALGRNEYDGFMAGLLIHDLTFPENRFRFAFAPLYGTKSNNLVGAASVGYIWYPENLFKEVMLQADAKSFDYATTDFNVTSPLYARYTKVAPSLTFTFNEHNSLSPVTRELTLKAYSINEEHFNISGDSMSVPTLSSEQKTYALLRYKHTNSRTYNPFDYSFEAQMGEDFTKLGAEMHVRIDYFRKGKALHVRAYAGKFIASNSNPAVAQRYYLNSTYTGVNDYLYDGTYFGRTSTEGITAQQVSVQEGGLKIPTQNTIGRSDNYMLALNLNSDLPIKLPIRLFFDICTYSDPTETTGTNNKVLFDGGVQLALLSDRVTINFPLIMSDNLNNYLKNTYGNSNAIGRSITFTFNLNDINWLKIPERVLKTVQ